MIKTHVDVVRFIEGLSDFNFVIIFHYHNLLLIGFFFGMYSSKINVGFC